jgi:hypothetical protein
MKQIDMPVWEKSRLIRKDRRSATVRLVLVEEVLMNPFIQTSGILTRRYFHELRLREAMCGVVGKKAKVAHDPFRHLRSPEICIRRGAPSEVVE